MWNKYFAILTGILLTFYHGNIHCHKNEIDQQFPLGAIGCLFSDTQSLCDPGARCIDDLVFGICSSDKIPDNFADILENGFPDNIAYMLDKHGLEKLEKELLELVLDGFTWSDAYAQCVVQNVLYSLGTKQPFSKQACLRLHLDWKASVQNEIMSILEILNKKMGNLGKHTLTGNFEKVPVITRSFDGMPEVTISQKRDELIRVHKYFDKNEKVHKRLFAPSIQDFNFLSHDLREYPKSHHQSHVNYHGIGKNSGSLHEDLLLVKDYLAASRNQQQSLRSQFSKSLLMPVQGQAIQLPMLLKSFPLDDSLNNAEMKYQPFSSQTESLENLDEILPDVLGSISPDVPANVKSADVVDTNFAALEMDHGFQGQNLKTKVDPLVAGVSALGEHEEELEKASGLAVVKSGINQTEVEIKSNDNRYFILTFVLCGFVTAILIVVIIIYLIQRNSQAKDKLKQITAVQDGNESASNDYQDLCRQRMQSKLSEKPEPLHAAISRVGSVSETQVCSPTSRSSTSSWSEEPIRTNMDITTGHIVLSYMEDHLKNKDKLDHEWQAMCAYEADPCSTKVAEDPANTRKNRYGDVLPYDHSRVVLNAITNVSGSDYINASTITDHDPRNPAYVATQGPLPHTVADFWQMVWEQGSMAIVMLTKLTEKAEVKCHRYWPEEGSDLYHIYEVHLVSEHVWCDDYLVRSFYLKNLQTSETRTVTQFHFLTWPDLGVPGSIKALLEFRRKVNKSYRGHSCPIVVHCSDGCGRTGTYCLIDMVLNRMTKGAKEIDIAATLEHIRDQRVNMVTTKEQFQFALAAVAEEVHAILKALPQ